MFYLSTTYSVLENSNTFINKYCNLNNLAALLFFFFNLFLLLLSVIHDLSPELNEGEATSVCSSVSSLVLVLQCAISLLLLVVPSSLTLCKCLNKYISRKEKSYILKISINLKTKQINATVNIFSN